MFVWGFSFSLTESFIIIIFSEIIVMFLAEKKLDDDNYDENNEIR